MSQHQMNSEANTLNESKDVYSKMPLSSEIEEDSEENEYIVPDGGWGWVVTISVFFVYIILDGSVFTFGLIYVELLDYFNESGGKTAVIGALLYGFPLILAPIVCALVLHTGFRTVGLIGGVLVSVAFFMCTFAPNIDFLTVILGIFGSIGMEMGYVSALLCITYYFDKKRGLATGLAMAGSGVGTFLFAPLLEYLLVNYTWKGACLVIAAICANLIPCSLIFLPLKKKPKKSADSSPEEGRKLLNGHNPNIHDRRMSKSLTHLPDLRMQHEELHKSEPGLIIQQPPHLEPHVNILSNSYHHGGYAMAFSLTSLHSLKDTTDNESKVIVKQAKDVFSTCWSQIIKIIKSSVDKTLFKDPCFILFGISNFLLCVYFGLPYMYIPHLAQLSGIEEQHASFLVSIIGITTTVAQIALGYIGDKTNLSVPMYGLCMVICGGSLIVMPLYAGEYWVFCLLSVLFGIGISGNYALTTLILIEILGLEKLTVAFGLLQLQQGVSTLFGTPIGGWVYDATGSYYWAFVSGGICIITSGLVLAPIPFLLKYRMTVADQAQVTTNEIRAVETNDTEATHV